MLSGRLAVVTGGGGGIGSAVCRILAREGARVTISDLHLDECNKTLEHMEGKHHTTAVLDVTSQESVQLVADQIKAIYDKTADIVVNAAGITKDAYVTKLTSEMFDDVVDVNLKGTFNVNKVFAMEMKKQKVPVGSIVNFSSIMGTLIGNAGQCNYAATKAGVIGFTKSLAKELALSNISVNCVSPGLINTEMLATVPEQILDTWKSFLPLGRWGEPAEVAEVVAFLASNRCLYLTGTKISLYTTL